MNKIAQIGARGTNTSGAKTSTAKTADANRIDPLEWTVFVEQRLAAPYHLSHRGVPIGGDKRAVAAYQRGGEPVGRRVSLPAVQVLRVDPSAGVRP